jgi:hypothetical protein
LTDQRIEPRNLTSHDALLERILDVTYDHLEAKFHILGIEFISLRQYLSDRKILESILHGSSLNLKISANCKFGFNRQF